MRRIITFTLLAILAVPAFCQTPATGKSNGHDYVDLGLSVKWATCNIGATSPTDFGSFFLGETSTNDSDGWETYKFRVSGDSHDNVVVSKYSSNSKRGTIDNKTVLDYSDDAAYGNWGNTWRMATLEEWKELLENCTWSYCQRDRWHVGYFKVISKKNGNSILLPFPGHMGGNLNDRDYDGYYWTSSLNPADPTRAYYIHISSGGGHKMESTKGRWYGFSIRPVIE